MLVAVLQQEPLWTSQHRAVLTALWRSLGGALDRAEQARQLEGRAALNAFVALTEAVGTETNLHLLARHAQDVLQASVPELSVVYHELEGGLWKARTVSDNVDPQIAATARKGHLEDTPSFQEAVQARGPVFTDGWDPQREGIAHTEVYGAVAFYPYFKGEQPFGMLAMGTVDSRVWTSQDRVLFTAVGHSLGLALDRAIQAETLQAQNKVLEARTQALEAFMQLTKDLGVQGDRLALIRRAQEVVRSLLPQGYAAYFEPVGGRWWIRSQVGSMRSPSLQALVDAEGVDLESGQNMMRPWTTRQPLYQDAYDVTTDGLDQGLLQNVGATATLPLVEHGNVVGIFGMVQYEGRTWSPVDRAVLEGVVRSLSLALERGESVARLEIRSQELERSNTRLEAANEELEAFTYSVSHDLRTPVRHIISFGDLLRRELPTPLDAKAERYFRIISSAAVTLSGLIDGMLEVSRTSRQPLRAEQVNLERLFTEAHQKVGIDLPQRQIDWQIRPLPTVVGDAELLRRVITALVDNAVKYTRSRERALIEIWAEDRGQNWAVLVRDNGVGFDPKYQNKLFTMFQRLHRAEDFEGVAVSLANARRILARHGGTMTADGQPDVGATFGFILPRAAP
ncbi:Phytochrome, two-component sensor histidine kinase [Deinococcus marmoris]|uniref:histidine kinase n=2 Tax=Deinococcus marmoris TaxID=249408 RepID=A0A1U7P1A7_9DEIO|nr:Phytochrome, two-component sensor histidine kinase [Deinococcus marmoris]